MSSAGPCLAPASLIRTGLRLIRFTSSPQEFELKMAILPARDVQGWYTAGAYSVSLSENRMLKSDSVTGDSDNAAGFRARQ